MKTKICSKCKKEKSLKEFCINRAKKDGLNSRCKECAKECGKQWQKANPEKANKNTKKWRKSNPEKAKESTKKWQKNNPEKWRKIQTKAYYKIRQTAKAVIDGRMRGIIYKLLAGIRISSPFLENAMGYTAQQLRDHFESLLAPGMIWANYGTEWEIDHKIPLWSFDYSDITDPQFKKCWSLKNLQPLWKADNQKKGTKLNYKG